MKIRKITHNCCEIAIIRSDVVCISDVQTALDLVVNIKYETGAYCLVINKEAFIEDFFNLSTRLAGDILQKITTYSFKLAIVGNFNGYSSSSLKAFIYESNKGNNIYFVSSVEEAIEKLSKI